MTSLYTGLFALGLFTYRLFAVLLVLVFLSSGCNDDSDPLTSTGEINTPAELTEALNEIADKTPVPGFAVSIAKGDGIIYQEAFGYADVKNKAKYTNTTVQPIASVSKTFVAAAVAKAIEDGHFTLETDINDLLPVEVVNPNHATPVKVKHLVTHTSGLLDDAENYIKNSYFLLPGQDLSTNIAQIMQNGLSIVEREGLDLDEYLSEYYLEGGDLYSAQNFGSNAPGSAWSYSNVATSLMGYIIEYVTGEDFADYAKANVMMPLGMTNTTYNFDEVDLSNMAKWYYSESEEFPLYGNDTYPEGSIVSNNVEMGKFMLDMMKGASGAGGQLFSATAYNQIFSEQLPSGVVPAGFAENHGIFWYLNKGKFQHGGNSLGVSTFLEIDATGDSGYVLLTNMDGTFTENGPKYSDVAQQIDNAVKAFLKSR